MPCVTSTSALKKHVLKHAEVVKENSSAASASFIGKVFFSELETKMDRVRISAGRAGIVLNFIRFFFKYCLYSQRNYACENLAASGPYQC